MSEENASSPIYVAPGHYSELTNEYYHGSEGISKTKLDMFHNDPSSLEWAKKCPVDKEKLKTLDFGDAMHAISLEPHRLESDFFVLPALNLRTNVGKEEKKILLEENADKTILTFDEKNKLKLMFESIMANPEARKLIENPGVAEHSYYWNDPDSGVLCKCRPDRNLTGTSILMDVKTTEQLSKFHFSVEDYRYYVQDPFYLDGVNSCGVEEKDIFAFLVIQKTIELGRYPVRCVYLRPDLKAYGREQYKQDLYAYAKAVDSGKFNGYQECPTTYSLQKKIDNF